MKLIVGPPEHGSPERVLAAVELHFEANEPLAGLRLLGFRVWRHPFRKGVVYVTVPSRRDADIEKKWHELVRSVNSSSAKLDELRALVLEGYSKARGEEGIVHADVP